MPPLSPLPKPFTSKSGVVTGFQRPPNINSPRNPVPTVPLTKKQVYVPGLNLGLGT